MNKIPTAEEFLQTHPQISHYYDDKTNRMVCFDDDVKTAMIEFAKLHVEAALKKASENALVSADEGGYTGFVDEESILNSYPLENIK
jgi:hypothetical protein